MTIYVDPRRGSGDLLARFPPKIGDLMYLDSGDVMAQGNGPYGAIMWGVEVKKLDDVIGSMTTGRLVEQLGKMQEDYDFRYLLVEGEYRANRKTGVMEQRKENVQDPEGKWSEYWRPVMFGNKQKMTYAHFQSWLLSVLVGSGTYYLHTTTRQETVDTLVCLARFFDKKWDDHGSLKVFNDASQPPGLVIPSTVMCVARDMAPGVGWDKAIKAAEYFKTVRAMATASAAEWRKVDGFDKVLAERMVQGASEPHVLRTRTRRKKGGK